MKFNKIVCSLFIFIFATTGIFNIPVVAGNTNSLIMTYIEDSSAFNEWARRENLSNVGFITEGKYELDVLNTQKCANLIMKYVENDTLLWLSYCGFTTNPRLNVKDINSFIRMKIYIKEYNSELHFFIQDENGQKSYLPVVNYIQSNSFGNWAQVEIPILDFYDNNTMLDRTVISMLGIAWKRTSATNKTSSSEDESIYVTDLKVISMPSLYAKTESISENKVKISWNKQENCEKYNIYKNGILVAQTEDTFYTDEEFDVNTFESYEISFSDFYGNESMKSNKIENEFLFSQKTNVLFSVYDDLSPNSAYYFCWPNESSTSNGKYITLGTSSDSYKGATSLSFSFPAYLTYGGFCLRYSSYKDFSSYVQNGIFSFYVKTTDISDEISVEISDRNENSINLGTVITQGLGKWEKISFVLRNYSDADFLWDSIKDINLIYKGLKRTSSLDMLVDFIHIEEVPSDFKIFSTDENPYVVSPNTSYYIMCESENENASLYVAYYDENNRLIGVSKGKNNNGTMYALILSDNEITNKNIRLMCLEDSLEPIYKSYSLLCKNTYDLSLNTGKWYRYEQPDYKSLSKTALDASFLLDAPAGKHGFVKTQDGRFVFEDGTNANFWGTNVVGKSNFLKKEDIDVLAQAIAASGFNVVRVHHLDASYYSPNIFGSDKDSTTLDEEQMDKFNYLWYKLKEKGIYIIPSLLCSRVVTEDMGIQEAESINAGMKIEGMFDEDLIALQKKYAKDLLTYKNPYTNTTLATDAATVMFEVHNECNITRYGENSNYSITSDYYYDEFCSLFTDFLLDKYSTRENIELEWGENVSDNSDIEFEANYLSRGYSDAHIKDCREFLNYIAKNYHTQMMSYLKDELGVKVPLAGTNNASSDNLGDVYENAFYDYMDRHSYWSHPNGTYSFEKGLYTSYPSSILDAANYNIYSELSKNNVYGKPMLVSEWQAGLPNRYISEIQMISAAIFKYQGFSSCEFDFLNGDLPTENKITTTLDIMANPVSFGMVPAASVAYHNISEAQNGYYVNYTEDDAYDISKQKVELDNMGFMIGKYGLSFSDVTKANAQNDADFLAKLDNARQSGIYQSSTNELLWNRNDRFFTVNNPYVNSVSGFIKGKLIELDYMKVDVGNDFASVSLTPCNQNTLYDAPSLLLTVGARCMNTGYKTDSDARVVVNAGEAPILVEQVEGKIYVEGDNFKVYVLSSSGERLKEADIETKDGYTVLNMTILDKTMHYEFVRED